MIANLTSLFIARQLQKQPIYEALAGQDGIHLPTSRSHDVTHEHQVEDILRQTPEKLPGRMRVREAMELAQGTPCHIWPVLRGSFFLGIVTREQLEKALAAGKKEQRLESLIDTQHTPHLHRDQPLHLALERMSRNHLDLLPVIHRADAHQLEGVVTLHDLLEAYGVQNTDGAQL